MPDDLRVALRIDARDRTRPGIRSARRNVRSLSGEIRRLGRAGATAERGVARATTGVDRLGTSARGTAATVRQLHALIIAYGAGRVVSAIVRAGLEMERLDFRFRAAAGSIQAGRREMAFVRAEAERLGIDLVAAADAYSGFAAAARGTALEGQAARDIFIAVAEAARVMGLSADDTSGVLLAMQQIVSKGVVSAEELRGQLGERLPGAFQIAARAMGTTTRELGEMLQRGELLAEDLLPRFAVELRRSVAEGVPEATRSAAASFARLTNAMRDLNTAVAESGLLDLLTGAARLGEAAARALNPDRTSALARLAEVEERRRQALRSLERQQIQPRPETEAARRGIEAEVARLEERARDILAELQMATTAAARPLPSAAAAEEPALGASEFRLAAIARQQQAELEALHRADEQRRREALDRLLGDYGRYTEGLRRITEAEADIAGPFEAARTEAGRWRDETLDALGLAAGANDEYARRVDALYRGQLVQIYAEEADARLEASQRWEDGVRLALQRMESDTETAAARMANAVEDAVVLMEDAWVRFAQTGKFEMSSLADFVIAEMARMAYRQHIQPGLRQLIGGFAGLFGSGPTVGNAPAPPWWNVSHAGGIAGAGNVFRTGVDPRAFIGAPRFHGGGIAGDEVPILARRGEGIFTPEQMAAMGGPQRIEVRIDNRGTPQRVAEARATPDVAGWVLDIVTDDIAGGGRTARAIEQIVPGANL